MKKEPTKTAVGIDIGHSTVKVSGDGFKFMFPSVAIPALRISDPGEAASAELEKVSLNGKPWFFGDTALVQGGHNWATGLSDDWIATQEHTALIQGALKKLEQRGIPTPDVVVVGLPVQSMKSQGSKDQLRGVLQGILPNANVQVVPQPFGAFSTITLDVNGRPDPQNLVHLISWAIIDIGFYTTDFILMNRGRWVEMASASCPGISMAAEHLMQLLAAKDIAIDMSVADAALRNGSLTYFGKQTEVAAEVKESLEMAASKIIDTADRHFTPHASKLNGILVCGGGAPVVMDLLAQKWPHVTMAADHRMCVVEGMRRLGKAMATN